MGYTATTAGTVMAPVGLFAIILSPIVGKTVMRFDPRWYASFSFLVFALVMWMRSQFNTLVDYDTIMVPTIIQGVAVAFFFIPLMTITLSGLPPERVPAASGLSNFVRIMAGAVGTSVTTTFWERRATLHHAQLTESLTQGNAVLGQTLDSLQALGLNSEQAMAQIERLVSQQVFTMAAADIFHISSLLFLLLIPVIWLAQRSHASPSAGGAADALGAH